MIAEGPVLLAGDDGVTVRVREELAGAGVATVTICSTPDAIAAQAARTAGAKVVVGDAASAVTWESAGVDRARSIGLIGPDDLPNLSAALLVADRVPDAPLVVRLFSPDLAPGVVRMLGGRATVVSEIELAAPAFVQAALSGNTGQRVTIAGRVLEVAEVDPGDPTLVVALANADTPTDVLPPREAQDDRVLGLVDRAALIAGARGAMPSTVARQRLGREMPSTTPAGRRHSRRTRLAATLRAVPSRAWILLATIAAVAGMSTTVFALSEHLDAIDSFYFTVTTMATVGYGDVNLAGAPDWLKLYDIGLMVVSAVLLASVLALVTDLLVRSRIDRALGRFPRPTCDHVIVCGLGKAGSRILAALHELEVPCIGVEQDPNAAGIAVARALEIPVVFADARSPGTLESLHLDAAQSILAVTSDDLANIQCGLAAREQSPDLRIVLRIFDPRLAERLDSSIELDLTRSISALAAPAFSAALLGGTLAESLPLSNVPLRVLEADVHPRSPLVGQTIRAVNHGRELRVLAVDGRWRPVDDKVIEAGEVVSVVGTRSACDRLVGSAATGPVAASSAGTVTGGGP